MTPFDHPIHVSRPGLPPLDAYADGLREIWASKWLTNGGPVFRRFRASLRQALQAPNLGLFTNGALALQVGLQGMGLDGEVITTAFSFAATTNALVQCGLAPVFADIEPNGLSLDPDGIEALITPRTSAILAVHLFGLPCEVDRLQRIATAHGLALIYDAAHAFGVTVGGQPIGGFGDLSMFSLHATKLFHSVEGGVLTYRDPSLGPVFDALCNHGLGPDGDVQMAGLNAKMSELQALMGELMLGRVGAAILHGAAVEATYRARLSGLPGLSFLPEPRDGTNHSFMPILVHEPEFGVCADGLQQALRSLNVLTRRYFHPLLCDMTAFQSCRTGDGLPQARRTVRDILALPTYSDLAIPDVHRICDMVDAIHRRTIPVRITPAMAPHSA